MRYFILLEGKPELFSRVQSVIRELGLEKDVEIEKDEWSHTGENKVSIRIWCNSPVVCLDILYKLELGVPFILRRRSSSE